MHVHVFHFMKCNYLPLPIFTLASRVFSLLIPSRSALELRHPHRNIEKRRKRYEPCSTLILFKGAPTHILFNPSISQPQECNAITLNLVLRLTMSKHRACNCYKLCKNWSMQTQVTLLFLFKMKNGG
jgi:hypothetical protein